MESNTGFWHKLKALRIGQISCVKAASSFYHVFKVEHIAIYFCPCISSQEGCGAQTKSQHFSL